MRFELSKEETNPGALRPILVTGSHRSGSTWAGRMLSLDSRIAYVQEPFNPGTRLSVARRPMDYWFQYIDDDNAHHYVDILDDVFAFRYPLLRNVRRANSAREVASVSRAQLAFLSARIQNKTPLLKDPIALFSAEWLSRTYDMNVVVLIRHPAAFCASLKEQQWGFVFSHFRDQPRLMERYLEPFAREIKEFARCDKEIVEQGILLWNCIQHTIRLLSERQPDWIFVKHEDLSSAPESQFRGLYERLNLRFSSRIEKRVREYSGLKSAPPRVADSAIHRESVQNILNWKERLTQDEIQRIREGTEDVARHFYSEKSW